jgi:excisionase family DNA binding protein
MTSRERAALDQRPPPELPEHVDVAGAARALGVSQKTVYRLVADGALPHLRVGRLIRIAAADLEALRGDPAAADRSGRSAAHTRRPPRARQPLGKFARMARGLPAARGRPSEDLAP